MKKRFAVIAVVFALVLGMFAGCGSQSDSSAEDTSSSVNDERVADEASAEESSEEPEESSVEMIEEPEFEEPEEPIEDEPEELPDESEEAPEPPEEEESTEATGTNENIVAVTDTPITLTCWTATLRSLESLTETLNELEFIQIMEEKTNVHIEWQQASSTGSTEQFQIMVASGDYTDMIFDLTSMYSGGVTKALEDSVVIDLTDYIEEYAPNYYYIVNYDDELRKDVVTDDGQYLVMYGCYDYESTGYKPLSGPMIRTDWLDQLGLDVPVTYDDYYEVALAFKSEYNCSDPILIMQDGMFASGYFTGGYGTSGFSYSGTGADTVGLYREDGVVKSSLLEDGYIEYLTMMNKWYTDGAISVNFYSNPANNMDSNYNNLVYNDQAGVFLGDAVNMTGLADMAVSDTFALTGAPDPVQNEGDVSQFGYNRTKAQGHDGVISTACTEPEIAIAWLDQWYSQEGYTLGNYGVLDETFEYNDAGLPVYTDLIMNNPDGLSQQQATVYYTNAFVPGLYTQDTRFNMWTQDILDTVDTWTDSTTGEALIPTVSLTVEESETYSNLASDIQTFASENVVKYITGELPLDEFSDFQDQLIEMGLQTCIDVYQSALDRYATR